MKENSSLVSSAGDLNDTCLSALMIVCGSSSRLTHTTLVPAATVSVAGAKAKLSITICAAGAAGCCAIPTAAYNSKAPPAADARARRPIDCRMAASLCQGLVLHRRGGFRADLDAPDAEHGAQLVGRDRHRARSLARA